MDKRHLPFSAERKRLISERTRLAMARPEVKEKLIALKGNGNGFKKGKLNPMFGKKGKKAFAWKGDNAGYCAIHAWIVNKKGKPKNCSKCGKEQIKRNGYRGIDWANIDHKYKRKLTDYIALCKKCHTFYDRKNNRKNYRELNLDRNVLLELFNSRLSIREIQRRMKVGSHHTIINYLKKYKIYVKTK